MHWNEGSGLAAVLFIWSLHVWPLFVTAVIKPEADWPPHGPQTPRSVRQGGRSLELGPPPFGSVSIPIYSNGWPFQTTKPNYNYGNFVRGPALPIPFQGPVPSGQPQGPALNPPQATQFNFGPSGNPQTNPNPDIVGGRPSDSFSLLPVYTQNLPEQKITYSPQGVKNVPPDIDRGPIWQTLGDPIPGSPAKIVLRRIFSLDPRNTYVPIDKGFGQPVGAMGVSNPGPVPLNPEYLGFNSFPLVGPNQSVGGLPNTSRTIIYRIQHPIVTKVLSKNQFIDPNNPFVVGTPSDGTFNSAVQPPLDTRQLPSFGGLPGNPLGSSLPNASDNIIPIYAPKPDPVSLEAKKDVQEFILPDGSLKTVTTWTEPNGVRRIMIKRTFIKEIKPDQIPPDANFPFPSANLDPNQPSGQRYIIRNVFLPRPADTSQGVPSQVQNLMPKQNLNDYPSPPTTSLNPPERTNQPEEAPAHQSPPKYQESGEVKLNFLPPPPIPGANFNPESGPRVIILNGVKYIVTPSNELIPIENTFWDPQNPSVSGPQPFPTRFPQQPGFVDPNSGQNFGLYGPPQFDNNGVPFFSQPYGQRQVDLGRPGGYPHPLVIGPDGRSVYPPGQVDSNQFPQPPGLIPGQPQGPGDTIGPPSLLRSPISMGQQPWKPPLGPGPMPTNPFEPINAARFNQFPPDVNPPRGHGEFGPSGVASPIYGPSLTPDGVSVTAAPPSQPNSHGSFLPPYDPTLHDYKRMPDASGGSLMPGEQGRPGYFGGPFRKPNFLDSSYMPGQQYRPSGAGMPGSHDSSLNELGSNAMPVSPGNSYMPEEGNMSGRPPGRPNFPGSSYMPGEGTLPGDLDRIPGMSDFPSSSHMPGEQKRPGDIGGLSGMENFPDSSNMPGEQNRPPNIGGSPAMTDFPGMPYMPGLQSRPASAGGPSGMPDFQGSSHMPGEQQRPNDNGGPAGMPTFPGSSYMPGLQSRPDLRSPPGIPDFSRSPFVPGQQDRPANVERPSGMPDFPGSLYIPGDQQRPNYIGGPDGMPNFPGNFHMPGQQSRPSDLGGSPGMPGFPGSLYMPGQRNRPVDVGGLTRMSAHPDSSFNVPEQQSRPGIPSAMAGSPGISHMPGEQLRPVYVEGPSGIPDFPGSSYMPAQQSTHGEVGSPSGMPPFPKIPNMPDMSFGNQPRYPQEFQAGEHPLPSNKGYDISNLPSGALASSQQPANVNPTVPTETKPNFSKIISRLRPTTSDWLTGKPIFVDPETGKRYVYDEETEMYILVDKTTEDENQPIPGHANTTGPSGEPLYPTNAGRQATRPNGLPMGPKDTRPSSLPGDRPKAVLSPSMPDSSEIISRLRPIQTDNHIGKPIYVDPKTKLQYIYDEHTELYILIDDNTTEAPWGASQSKPSSSQANNQKPSSVTGTPGVYPTLSMPRDPNNQQEFIHLPSEMLSGPESWPQKLNDANGMPTMASMTHDQSVPAIIPARNNQNRPEYSEIINRLILILRIPRLVFLDPKTERRYIYDEKTEVYILIGNQPEGLDQRPTSRLPQGYPAVNQPNGEPAFNSGSTDQSAIPSKYNQIPDNLSGGRIINLTRHAEVKIDVTTSKMPIQLNGTPEYPYEPTVQGGLNRIPHDIISTEDGKLGIPSGTPSHDPVHQPQPGNTTPEKHPELAKPPSKIPGSSEIIPRLKPVGQDQSGKPLYYVDTETQGMYIYDEQTQMYILLEDGTNEPSYAFRQMPGEQSAMPWVPTRDHGQRTIGSRRPESPQTSGSDSLPVKSQSPTGQGQFNSLLDDIGNTPGDESPRPGDFMGGSDMPKPASAESKPQPSKVPPNHYPGMAHPMGIPNYKEMVNRLVLTEPDDTVGRPTYIDPETKRRFIYDEHTEMYVLIDETTETPQRPSALSHSPGMSGDGTPARPHFPNNGTNDLIPEIMNKLGETPGLSPNPYTNGQPYPSNMPAEIYPQLARPVDYYEVVDRLRPTPDVHNGKTIYLDPKTELRYVYDENIKMYLLIEDQVSEAPQGSGPSMPYQRIPKPDDPYGANQQPSPGSAAAALPQQHPLVIGPNGEPLHLDGGLSNLPADKNPQLMKPPTSIPDYKEIVRRLRPAEPDSRFEKPVFFDPETERRYVYDEHTEMYLLIDDATEAPRPQRPSQFTDYPRIPGEEQPTRMDSTLKQPVIVADGVPEGAFNQLPLEPQNQGKGGMPGKMPSDHDRHPTYSKPSAPPLPLRPNGMPVNPESPLNWGTFNQQPDGTENTLGSQIQKPTQFTDIPRIPGEKQPIRGSLQKQPVIFRSDGMPLYPQDSTDQGGFIQLPSEPQTQEKEEMPGEGQHPTFSKPSGHPLLFGLDGIPVQPENPLDQGAFNQLPDDTGMTPGSQILKPSQFTDFPSPGDEQPIRMDSPHEQPLMVGPDGMPMHPLLPTDHGDEQMPDNFIGVPEIPKPTSSASAASSFVPLQVSLENEQIGKPPSGISSHYADFIPRLTPTESDPLTGNPIYIDSATLQKYTHDDQTEMNILIDQSTKTPQTLMRVIPQEHLDIGGKKETPVHREGPGNQIEFNQFPVGSEQVGPQQERTGGTGLIPSENMGDPSPYGQHLIESEAPSFKHDVSPHDVLVPKGTDTGPKDSWRPTGMRGSPESSLNIPTQQSHSGDRGIPAEMASSLSTSNVPEEQHRPGDVGELSGMPNTLGSSYIPGQTSKPSDIGGDNGMADQQIQPGNKGVPSAMAGSPGTPYMLGEQPRPGDIEGPSGMPNFPGSSYMPGEPSRPSGVGGDTRMPEQQIQPGEEEVPSAMASAPGTSYMPGEPRSPGDIRGPSGMPNFPGSSYMPGEPSKPSGVGGDTRMPEQQIQPGEEGVPSAMASAPGTSFMPGEPRSPGDIRGPSGMPNFPGSSYMPGEPSRPSGVGGDTRMPEQQIQPGEEEVPSAMAGSPGTPYMLGEQPRPGDIEGPSGMPNFPGSSYMPGEPSRPSGVGGDTRMPEQQIQPGEEEVPSAMASAPGTSYMPGEPHSPGDIRGPSGMPNFPGSSYMPGEPSRPSGVGGDTRMPEQQIQPGEEGVPSAMASAPGTSFMPGEPRSPGDIRGPSGMPNFPGSSYMPGEPSKPSGVGGDTRMPEQQIQPGEEGVPSAMASAPGTSFMPGEPRSPGDIRGLSGMPNIPGSSYMTGQPSRPVDFGGPTRMPEQQSHPGDKGLPGATAGSPGTPYVPGENLRPGDIRGPSGMPNTPDNSYIPGQPSKPSDIGGDTGMPEQQIEPENNGVPSTMAGSPGTTYMPGEQHRPGDIGRPSGMNDTPGSSYMPGQPRKPLDIGGDTGMPEQQSHPGNKGLPGATAGSPGTPYVPGENLRPGDIRGPSGMPNTPDNSYIPGQPSKPSDIGGDSGMPEQQFQPVNKGVPTAMADSPGTSYIPGEQRSPGDTGGPSGMPNFPGSSYMPGQPSRPLDVGGPTRMPEQLLRPGDKGVPSAMAGSLGPSHMPGEQGRPSDIEEPSGMPNFPDSSYMPGQPGEPSDEGSPTRMAEQQNQPGDKGVPSAMAGFPATSCMPGEQSRPADSGGPSGMPNFPGSSYKPGQQSIDGEKGAPSETSDFPGGPYMPGNQGRLSQMPGAGQREPTEPLGTSPAQASATIHHPSMSLPDYSELISRLRPLENDIHTRRPIYIDPTTHLKYIYDEQTEMYILIDDGTESPGESSKHRHPTMFGTSNDHPAMGPDGMPVQYIIPYDSMGPRGSSSSDPGSVPRGSIPPDQYNNIISRLRPISPINQSERQIYVDPTTELRYVYDEQTEMYLLLDKTTEMPLRPGQFSSSRIPADNRPGINQLLPPGIDAQKRPAMIDADEMPTDSRKPEYPQVVGPAGQLMQPYLPEGEGVFNNLPDGNEAEPGDQSQRPDDLSATPGKGQHPEDQYNQMPPIKPPNYDEIVARLRPVEPDSHFHIRLYIDPITRLLYKYDELWEMYILFETSTFPQSLDRPGVTQPDGSRTRWPERPSPLDSMMPGMSPHHPAIVKLYKNDPSVSEIIKRLRLAEPDARIRKPIYIDPVTKLRYIYEEVTEVYILIPEESIRLYLTPGELIGTPGMPISPGASNSQLPTAAGTHPQTGGPIPPRQPNISFSPDTLSPGSAYASQNPVDKAMQSQNIPDLSEVIPRLRPTMTKDQIGRPIFIDFVTHYKYVYDQILEIWVLIESQSVETSETLSKATAVSQTPKPSEIDEFSPYGQQPGVSRAPEQYHQVERPTDISAQQKYPSSQEGFMPLSPVTPPASRPRIPSDPNQAPGISRLPGSPQLLLPGYEDVRGAGDNTLPGIRPHSSIDSASAQGLPISPDHLEEGPPGYDGTITPEQYKQQMKYIASITTKKYSTTVITEMPGRPHDFYKTTGMPASQDTLQRPQPAEFAPGGNYPQVGKPDSLSREPYYPSPSGEFNTMPSSPASPSDKKPLMPSQSDTAPGLLNDPESPYEPLPSGAVTPSRYPGGEMPEGLSQISQGIEPFPEGSAWRPNEQVPGTPILPASSYQPVNTGMAASVPDLEQPSLNGLPDDQTKPSTASSSSPFSLLNTHEAPQTNIDQPEKYQLTGSQPQLAPGQSPEMKIFVGPAIKIKPTPEQQDIIASHISPEMLVPQTDNKKIIIMVPQLTLKPESMPTSKRPSSHLDSKGKASPHEPTASDDQIIRIKIDSLPIFPPSGEDVEEMNLPTQENQSSVPTGTKLSPAELVIDYSHSGSEPMVSDVMPPLLDENPGEERETPISSGFHEPTELAPSAGAAAHPTGSFSPETEEPASPAHPHQPAQEEPETSNNLPDKPLNSGLEHTVLVPAAHAEAIQPTVGSDIKPSDGFVSSIPSLPDGTIARVPFAGAAAHPIASVNPKTDERASPTERHQPDLEEPGSWNSLSSKPMDTGPEHIEHIATAHAQATTVEPAVGSDIKPSNGSVSPFNGQDGTPVRVPSVGAAAPPTGSVTSENGEPAFPTHPEQVGQNEPELWNNIPEKPANTGPEHTIPIATALAQATTIQPVVRSDIKPSDGSASSLNDQDHHIPSLADIKPTIVPFAGAAAQPAGSLTPETGEPASPAQPQEPAQEEPGSWNKLPNEQTDTSPEHTVSIATAHAHATPIEPVVGSDIKPSDGSVSSTPSLPDRTTARVPSARSAAGPAGSLSPGTEEPASLAHPQQPAQEEPGSWNNLPNEPTHNDPEHTVSNAAAQAQTTTVEPVVGSVIKPSDGSVSSTPSLPDATTARLPSSGAAAPPVGSITPETEEPASLAHPQQPAQEEPGSWNKLPNEQIETSPQYTIPIATAHAQATPIEPVAGGGIKPSGGSVSPTPSLPDGTTARAPSAEADVPLTGSLTPETEQPASPAHPQQLVQEEPGSWSNLPSKPTDANPAHTVSIATAQAQARTIEPVVGSDIKPSDGSVSSLNGQDHSVPPLDDGTPGMMPSAGAAALPPVSLTPETEEPSFLANPQQPAQGEPVTWNNLPDKPLDPNHTASISLAHAQVTTTEAIVGTQVRPSNALVSSLYGQDHPITSLGDTATPTVPSAGAAARPNEPNTPESVEPYSSAPSNTEPQQPAGGEPASWNNLPDIPQDTSLEYTPSISSAHAQVTTTESFIETHTGPRPSLVPESQILDRPTPSHLDNSLPVVSPAQSLAHTADISPREMIEPYLEIPSPLQPQDRPQDEPTLIKTLPGSPLDTDPDSHLNISPTDLVVDKSAERVSVPERPMSNLDFPSLTRPESMEGASFPGNSLSVDRPSEEILLSSAGAGAPVEERPTKPISSSDEGVQPLEVGSPGGATSSLEQPTDMVKSPGSQPTVIMTQSGWKAVSGTTELVTPSNDVLQAGHPSPSLLDILSPGRTNQPSLPFNAAPGDGMSPLMPLQPIFEGGELTQMVDPVRIVGDIPQGNLKIYTGEWFLHLIEKCNCSSLKFLIPILKSPKSGILISNP